MSDEIEYQALQSTGAVGGTPADLGRLHDVPVELAVEIGRTRMTIGETLALAPGSIVTLNRTAGEPVDLLVNGKPIARGEVVVIDEEFGLRITEVVAGMGNGKANANGHAAAAPAPAPAPAPEPVAEPAPAADPVAGLPADDDLLGPVE
jgi:flagellar motor switch protein FliN/FliY